MDKDLNLNSPENQITPIGTKNINTTYLFLILIFFIASIIFAILIGYSYGGVKYYQYYLNKMQIIAASTASDKKAIPVQEKKLKVEKYGISVEISPFEGPTGTIVSLSLKGIPQSPYPFQASIGFRDKRGYLGKENEMLKYPNGGAIDTKDVFPGNDYKFQLRIPEHVLNAANSETPTETGLGIISFNFSDKDNYTLTKDNKLIIDIPFSVIR